MADNLSTPDSPQAAPAAFRGIGAGSGALLNGVSFAVTMLVTFFLSPFMLRRLGDASYGLLSVTWELGGYFGLFDLGLRSAINYYVSRAAAGGSLSAVHSVIRNAFWLLLAITGAGLLLSWPLAMLATRWIQIGPLDPASVHSVLCLGFAVFSLNLTGTLASAVLSGIRRFDWLVFTNIAGTAATGLLVFTAIRAGMGLFAVAFAQALGTMLPWIVQQYLLHRWKLMPGLWPPRLDRPAVSQMASYGSANLAMRISELLAFQTDQFIIVQAAGPAAVAQYHIGRYFALHSRSLINVLSMVLAPYFTALSVSGSPTEMREFFLRINRWICSLAFLLLSGVMAFGQPFLALWVGTRYVEGDWWRRSDAVLMIFACAMAFRSLHAVPYQYLLGTRRLRFPTLALAGEALFIAVAAVLAIRWKGITGVALVKCISSFGLAVMLLLPYALREIGIPARHYLRSSLAPALITGAATAAAGVLFRVLFPVSGWLQLFSGAAVSACAGCIAFLCTATQEDREFLRRKLRTPLG